jgi:beta-glucuronidase
MARLAVCAALLHAACAQIADLSFSGNEFPLFPSRRVLTLDGRWQFAWLGPVPDVLTTTPAGISTPLVTVVPSSFDLLPYPNKSSLAGVRGAVLYRSSVRTNPNTFARLRFGACGFYCSVFVDGIKVGEHGGNGYTSFWVQYSC